MLKQRLLTGIALALGFVLILFWGTAFMFPLLLILVLFLGGREWARLAGIDVPMVGYSFAFALCLAFVLISLDFDWLVVAMQILVWLSAFFWMFTVLEFRRQTVRLYLLQRQETHLISGALLLLSSSLSVLWLSQSSNGQWHVLVLFLIIALADSGAYFTGKAWGKHKLAPSISPGKTIEGLLGGLCANGVLGIVLILILDIPFHTWGVLFLLVLMTSLMSVIGDLLESAAKRQAGVKDSGSLLPGHGGILDRIDGVLAAAPAFVLIQFYFQVLP